MEHLNVASCYRPIINKMLLLINCTMGTKADSLDFHPRWGHYTHRPHNQLICLPYLSTVLLQVDYQPAN